jgi:O-antigen/teichoic acid export membrane protein
MYIHSAWQKMRHPESLLRMVGLTAGSNIAIGGMGFLAGLITARLFGPIGRGEFAAIQSWSLLLASLIMLGLPEALIYFASREPAKAKDYLATTQLFIAGASLPSLAIGWLLLPLLLRAQQPETIQAAQIFFVLITLTYLIGSMPHHLLRAIGVWSTWNMFRLLTPLLWLLSLLIVFSTRAAMSAPELGYLQGGIHLAIAPIILLSALRVAQGRYQPAPTHIRSMLRYGLPSFLQILPATLNLRLDQMLMVGFLSSYQLGLYAVAVTWSSVIIPLLNAIGQVAFPRLSALNDPAQQVAFIRQTFTFIIPCTILITLILVALTPIFIPVLFGSDFSDAVPATLILCIAAAVAAMNLNIADTLRGLGRPKQSLIGEAIGLAVTATLLVYMITTWSIWGAALTSLLSYTATSIYLIMALKHTLKERTHAQA